MIFWYLISNPDIPAKVVNAQNTQVTRADSAALASLPQVRGPGLHKLWYPGIRDMSTWSKFGAHGEHGDVFLFSNLGAL